MPKHCPSVPLLTQYSVPLIKFKSISEDKGKEKTSITQLCAGLSIISSCKVSVHSHHQGVELPLWWAISPAVQTARNQLWWELGWSPPCFSSSCIWAQAWPGLCCWHTWPCWSWLCMAWWTSLAGPCIYSGSQEDSCLALPGHCQGPCLPGTSGPLHCTTLGSPEPRCPCGAVLPAAFWHVLAKLAT